MGFEVRQLRDGTYEWTVFASAFGLIMGTGETLDEVKVEMAIAEAELYENPYPPTVIEVMRSDYRRFAVDYMDPPISTVYARPKVLGDE